MVELKYASKQFGKMGGDELRLVAKRILIKIHAITGWTIPVSELMDILVEQFEKKLQEWYAWANEEEIEYAFRNKGLDIKDWGKAMNLGLIDEVMIPYLQDRFEVSKFEEASKKQELIEEKKELTEDDWEEWIESMKNYSCELIPTVAYDYLDRNGKIKKTPKEKNEYMDRAIAYHLLCLEPDTQPFYDFLKMRNKKMFTGDIVDTLKNIAKRMIVFDYLKTK